MNLDYVFIDLCTILFIQVGFWSNFAFYPLSLRALFCRMEQFADTQNIATVELHIECLVVSV